MRSNKPLWFNPTGDAKWDDYYTILWLFIGGYILFVGAFIGAVIL